MIVRVPMLTVTGYYDFHVEADKLDEAVQKIKDHKYQDVSKVIQHTTPNFDAAKELKDE